MIVDKETQEQRMSVCRSCEHFSSLQHCNICKCVMPFKTKLKDSKCPLDKWDSMDRWLNVRF